jgi:hypothetical protein
MTYPKQLILASLAFVAAVVLTAGMNRGSVLAQTKEPPRFPSGVRGLSEGQDKPPSGSWLLDARTDEERFRRLQVYSGGTDQQMWQMGYRYEQVYHAIVDQNWQLGAYHWGKLRDVFNVALMKRPNRTPNAEAMFLNNEWRLLDEALKAGDAGAVQKTFLAERQACIACHVAEGMSFLNQTPIFRSTASFPKR